MGKHVLLPRTLNDFLCIDDMSTSRWGRSVEVLTPSPAQRAGVQHATNGFQQHRRLRAGAAGCVWAGRALRRSEL